MTPEIAIVVSPRDWAENLHRFVADHGGAHVRARILDTREALDERYQVLVAEDLTSFLTPRLFDQLRRSGKRVLGVYDPLEPWGRERLAELGVDDTLPNTSAPEQFLRAIEALALTAKVDLDAELAELTTGPAAPAPDAPSPAPQRRQGRVTVVGGPSGGPGATEVAIGLADALRRRGERAVVVDADESAPSLAQRLGLPLHPNLRTAIDVVEHWSGKLTDVLASVSASGVEVLCGLPNVGDWSDVRPGEVADVVHDLAAIRDHVVVNIGHNIEDLGGGPLGGTGRYGMARTLLPLGETLVAVAAPTPVGLARLLGWIADVRALTSTPITVAMNRAPAAAFKRGELEAELARTYLPPSITFVPDERKVEEAAWEGSVVAAGGFTKAMDALAAAAVPAATRAGFTAAGKVAR